MATLAALLKHRGHDVSGSDEHVYPPMSDFLAAERIAVLEGYRAEHVGAAIDFVVVVFPCVPAITIDCAFQSHSSRIVSGSER